MRTGAADRLQCKTVCLGICPADVGSVCFIHVCTRLTQVGRVVHSEQNALAHAIHRRQCVTDSGVQTGDASTVCPGQQPGCTDPAEAGGADRVEQKGHPGDHHHVTSTSLHVTF